MPSAPTIFALSSGRPPAAIAVVRISGPRAGAALEALVGRRPQPRRTMLARVRDPRSGEQIDEALALWFPGPESETGEDMAEIHLHGGRAVIAATFEALSAVKGLRPAEAGEFTRRAFENGKLDLTRVEGLADLIGADTEAQRRHALRQLKGMLGKKAEEWRQRLIEALALVEAQIDFSADEGDVPETLAAQAIHVAREVYEDININVKASVHSERLREGLTVAITGPTNAGKSSLLNALARRDVAIVSPFPGTTRDVIEVHLDLGGYPVILVDTAGIRDSEDPIEQEGVRRAKARAAEAELVLWVFDAASGAERLTLPQSSQLDSSAETWLVANKVDLLNNNPESRLSNFEYKYFFISVKTGTGLSSLLEEIKAFASTYFAATETSLISRARQRACITRLSAILDRIIHRSGSDHASDLEFLAEDLRLAVREIGRITGRVDVEDVLDVIFQDFCIGK